LFSCTQLRPEITMRSRLRCRRTTIGPRHSLVISAPEEAPVQETHGLPEELMKRLPAAASELELRAAAAEVVSSALTVLDHRHFIRDLDSVWPTMKACKQLGSSEILTLTSALKEALACRLCEIAQAQSLPRRKVLALFNFMAELCWANYVSPSEHVIHQAIIFLLDTARACSNAGQNDPASWYVEGCAYFVAKVGEIMMLNPLEVFNVLDPLSARVACLARQLPRRTMRFIWILLQRRQRLWRGALYLSVSSNYWQEWARSRLVLVAHAKGDPRACPLAALPWPACQAIRKFMCERNAFDAAEVVWKIADEPDMPFTDDWLKDFIEQLPATPKAREGSECSEANSPVSPMTADADD
ncbi:Rae1-like protein, partial [Durusdinium trenchii]